MNYSKEIVDSFSEQTFEFLEVKEGNHLLEITLNRPEKKNAMNPVLVNELAYAMNYAHYNHKVWAVVLGANGDVFCSGADLKAFAAGNGQESKSTIPEPEEEVIIGDLFNGLHKPCIAKVHAPVYAGGFLLICGCTHVVAADTVKFSLPEVKRGIWPFQVMESMLQIMPGRVVLDWCMRAQTKTAEEATELGLVTELVKADDLDNHVKGMVEEIFEQSPAAIRHGLKAFDELRSKPKDEAHGYLKQMLYKVLETQDAGEGLSAFMEKRKPEWTGE